MSMVKGLDYADGCVSNAHSDAGQDADTETLGLRGGLQAGAASAQGNTEGTGSGIAERPAEDAVADSVTVELRVVGPTEFGDIELELPEGYYTGQGDSSIYVCSEKTLKRRV